MDKDDPNRPSSDDPSGSLVLGSTVVHVAIILMVMSMVGCNVTKHAITEQNQAMKRCLDAGASWTAHGWSSGSCTQPGQIIYQGRRGQ